jgi:cell division protein FtsB
MNFKSLLILFLIALFAWYLSFLATRLDRLHHRVETSWANLDSLLQRRAAIAIEIARSEIADPASSLLLTFAAHQAREASVKDRSQAETGLSGALGILLETSFSTGGDIEQELMQELGELNKKIKVAISLHVESVNRTQLIRSRWIIRTFRLAGSAPLPVTYEFEADVL